MPATRTSCTACWSDVGYELIEKHFTLHGKKQIAQGIDPESVGYNAVFRKRGR